MYEMSSKLITHYLQQYLKRHSQQSTANTRYICIEPNYLKFVCTYYVIYISQISTNARLEYLDANINARTVLVGSAVNVSSAIYLIKQTGKLVNRVSHYNQILVCQEKYIVH